jgi:hypothetical protein
MTTDGISQLHQVFREEQKKSSRIYAKIYVANFSAKIGSRIVTKTRKKYTFAEEFTKTEKI